MKLAYDYTADALYIELSGSLVDQTYQLDAGTMVDLDNLGKVVGIEVLQPAREWPLEDIKSRFELDGIAKAVIDALWGQTPCKPYPFARPLGVTAQLGSTAVWRSS